MNKFRHFSQTARKKTVTHGYDLLLSVSASLSRGFRLLSLLDGRLLVKLLLAKVADDAVARALSLKTTKRALEIFVFSDSDRGHILYPPSPQHLLAT